MSPTQNYLLEVLAIFWENFNHYIGSTW